jgi:DNA-binding FadR family transcriptional regulator
LTQCGGAPNSFSMAEHHPDTWTPAGAAASGGVRDRLVHELGVSIVGGKLQPGDSLRSEERFSAETGVSRGVYREAIRILAGKGLVHSRVKSGTRVNERASWNMLDVDVLAWMFEAKPPEDFVRDVFELRAIVEPAAAALAAQRRSSADVRDMRTALEDMERHGLLTAEGRAADQAFHRAVLLASRNEPLIALISTIGAAVEWTTRLARLDLGQKRDPIPDHRAVYVAIVERDWSASRKAMSTLVANALTDAGIRSQAFFME